MAVNNPTTINATGSSPLAGNVTLAAGSNVTLTQTGQQIQIAASGGGSSTNWPIIQNSTLSTDTVTITAGFQMIVAHFFNNQGTIVNNGAFVIYA
jgi:hypothetical protein